MDYSLIFEKLKSNFPKTKILKNEILAPYTTVKIGGPADIFIETQNDDEFLKILKFLSKLINKNEEINFSERNKIIKKFQNIFLAHNRNTKIPNINFKGFLNVFFGTQPQRDKHWCEYQEKTFKNPHHITILGNGSNVLISDSGIRGIVIKNNSKDIKINKNLIQISAGVQLPYAISFLNKKGFIDLEEFAYIPSTIGGAVYGNIHGIENNFSKYLQSIEVFDLETSVVYNLPSANLNWSYDTSEFQNQPNLIILSAVLNLHKGDPKKSRDKINQIIIKKTASQPINSLGSIFKNPTLEECQKIWGEQKSAGWIIDHELNWKGKKIGDAQISPLHANFIVNNKNATASNYFNLAKSVQDEIYKRFKLKLMFEIKFLGDSFQK